MKVPPKKRKSGQKAEPEGRFYESERPPPHLENYLERLRAEYSLFCSTISQHKKQLLKAWNDKKTVGTIPGRRALSKKVFTLNLAINHLKSAFSIHQNSFFSGLPPPPDFPRLTNLPPLENNDTGRVTDGILQDVLHEEKSRRDMYYKTLPSSCIDPRQDPANQLCISFRFRRVLLEDFDKIRLCERGQRTVAGGQKSAAAAQVNRSGSRKAEIRNLVAAWERKNPDKPRSIAIRSVARKTGLSEKTVKTYLVNRRKNAKE